MKEMDKKVLIGLASQGVSILMCIISMGLPQWYSNNRGHAGLFKVCSRKSGFCASYPVVPDWLGAAQAMIIIGLLAQCGCIAMCLLYYFKMKDKHHFVRWAAYVSFVAAGLVCICVIIVGSKLSWAENIYGGDIDPAASFYLAIVAVLLSAVSGGFLFTYNLGNENVPQ